MRTHLWKGFLLIAVAGMACGRSSGNTGGNPPVDGQSETAQSQIPADKFLSSENPGRWKEQKGEHEILVSEGRIFSVGKDRFRELKVVVPLQGNAQHYLEAGLVLDHSLKKELDKVAFLPGKPTYEFKLKVPAATPYASFVVIKCNQHDMWLKRVEPLPKKSGE